MVYYVTAPIIHMEGGEVVECPSDTAAVRRTKIIALNEVNAGAAAFSRNGDPSIGEFDDAVILKTFG